MPKNNNKNNKNNKSKCGWIIRIMLITFIIANIFSAISNMIINAFNITLALMTIIIIIFVGVLFDTIGISVTAASQVPFASMASKRIRGATQAISLIQRADQVSSFCNDVVGDICGIISGSAGGILVLRLAASGVLLNYPVLSIIISSLIAALTVGGKAFGKTLAINNNQRILYFVGYLLSFTHYGNRRRSTKRIERKRN